jgi:hypothetical protein
MTTLKKTVHDAITGEIVVRDYTADELAQYELDKIKDLELAATKAKVEADKAATRAAVLTRLGLTSDELLALLS